MLGVCVWEVFAYLLISNIFAAVGIILAIALDSLNMSDPACWASMPTQI